MKRFKDIAVFQYPTEAEVFLSKLDSEGIYAQLKDEHTINSDPLVSNAIGGVKLQVYQEDIFRASAIIRSIRGDVLLDNLSHVSCPQCRKSNWRNRQLVGEAKGIKQMLTAILFSVFPFFTGTKIQCNECKHVFHEK